MASATRTGDVMKCDPSTQELCSWTIHGTGWAAEATFGGRQMHNKLVEMAVRVAANGRV